MIEINTGTKIPDSELYYTAEPSSGPGGQHANRAHSRVTLHFDVNNSLSLSDQQKEKIKKRLGNKISKDGILSISSQRHRSQYANKREVSEKLQSILAEALKQRRKRKSTRIPEAQKRKRLQEKRRRSEIKKYRKKVDY